MTLLASTAALLGFLAVLLGAFGAHWLERHVPADRLGPYRTGVQYHALHVLAVLLAVLAARTGLASSLAITAGWCMVVGVVLFSGSLYVLTVTGVKRWGAVTPVGGLALLVGWALFFGAVAWR